MYIRILIAAVLLSLPVGCKKNKSTGATDNPAPAAGSHGSSGDRGKGSDKNKKDADAPNWLNDPRYKKDTERQSGGGTDAGGLPGKPGIGITVPEGLGQGGTTPAPGTPSAPGGPTPAPGGTPGKQVPSSTGTPASGTGRAVSEADLKDVWVFVDNRSGASGRMPSMPDILEALVAAKSPAAGLVRDGSIVLTGSRNRDSIWAYEKNAPLQGGLVAGSNGVERLSAAQLQGLLR